MMTPEDEITALAVKVTALEAERDELALCLLAEIGDPRGAAGLRSGWTSFPELGLWCLRTPDDRVVLLKRDRRTRALVALFSDKTRTVRVGYTIRAAMRWIEQLQGLS